MMADVPVGVFLSGGLDSGIIAAILAREAAPVELGYQRIFADHLSGIRAEQVLGRFATP